MFQTRVHYYIGHLREELRLVPTSEMGLYSLGIGGSTLPQRGDAIRYYLPEEIRVVKVPSPQMSATLEEIMEVRAPAANTKMNNYMPGMQRFKVADQVILNLFDSDYRRWRGTLPQADEQDTKLTKDGLYTPFNTASIPVSLDGFFITPKRTSRRFSHGGDLCLLNGMKYERDEGKDIFSVKELIEEGTGHELAEQNRHCTARQLNIPLYQVGRAKLMGIVTSEPAVADYGYHAAFLTKVNLTVKKIQEAANQIYADNNHSRYVPIEDAHIHPFEPNYLANFATNCIETMAITMQPILWLAGAVEFGESWLAKLKHVERH